VTGGAVTGSERTAVETFIQAIGNPKTGTRPWLAQSLRQKCQNLLAGTEPISAVQNDYAEAKMVQLIARDLKKIPMTNAEKTIADALIAATGNRKYGKQGGSI
jgi:hypothetical protein